jgi:SWI/SNF-related matrix-associated actin-dependent regulator of chromatin subfamily A3
MPMLLPLVFLVFTAKGNIPIVGNLFQENHLMLDHPTSPFDPMKLANCYYHNPHNPPPGGFNGTVAGPAGSIVAGTQMARWTASQMSGKSVEVHWQRMQADELFKNLNSGDELGETEPPPEVKTKLYPHQNKAVTFMLEREREILQPGGKASSLWHMQQNPFSGRMSWQHLVTHKEVHEKPTEAKGAILADDVCLNAYWCEL